VSASTPSETAPARRGGASATAPAPRGGASARPTPAHWLFELGCFALAIGSVFPLFHTAYAPIEDLPQHLAAIRILHDFDDPALGFARYFEIDLLRTQYLAYYLLVDLLAYVTNVERANELVVAGAIIALPLSARSLLRALGKDERLALLCFPLTYNAHLVLGFFNFLLAIPLSLYGVALAVRQRRHFAQARAAGLGVLALVCFYSHVVPFGLMCLAIGMCALARKPAIMVRMLAPLVPSALAALVWLQRSPAGQATATAAAGAGDGPQPLYRPARVALEQTAMWLTDVLRGESERSRLWAWAALVASVVLLALAERTWHFLRARSRSAKQQPTAVPADPAAAPLGAPDRLALQLAVAIWVLPCLCAWLYFAMPTSYDWIWPIAERFPLLAAIWLVIALPNGRWLRRTVLCAAFVLSAASFHHAGKAFARFDQEEVGDFDQALAAIPQGQRVIGLIFDRYSRNVTFAPFMHFVAYYQARKGGAVMFSFADFPQSPFRFREDNRPPRVRPRWEWQPELVRSRQDLAFYDYALVRGGPGAIARPGSGFTLRYHGERWSVFARTSPSAVR
jgi:hypothetical protein